MATLQKAVPPSDPNLFLVARSEADVAMVLAPDNSVYEGQATQAEVGGIQVSNGAGILTASNGHCLVG
jgi:hypothetical protein